MPKMLPTTTLNKYKSESALRRFARTFFSRTESTVFLVFLILCIVMSFASKFFLTPDNIFTVLSQVSRFGIIGAGVALVMITGGIDLSVGATTGLCACLLAFLSANTALPWPIVTLIIFLVGAAAGLANGLLITRLKLIPFIVTLAMAKVLSGLTLFVSGSRPISFSSPISWLGNGYIGPVPVPVIIMGLVVLFFSIYSQKTQSGRNLYAIGSNARAAELSGINVRRQKCEVYVIAGLLSALCGIVMAGTLQSAEATLGVGYEIEVVAAVIIGGVSLLGGVGTVWSALLGAAIMGILKNAFVLLGIRAYWQSVVIGLVILFAITVDALRNFKKRA